MSTPTPVNPFSALVRMLEQRIARQEKALDESRLQLTSAKDSFSAFEQSSKQVSLPGTISVPGGRGR